MSKFFPQPKKEGFRFKNGYQSLDGNGKPVWDITRSGSKVIYTRNKNGKKSYDVATPYDNKEQECKKIDIKGIKNINILTKVKELIKK